MKIGDNVQWTGRYADNSRIDKIVDIVTDLYGDIRYITEEISGKCRKGKAHETDLTICNKYPCIDCEYMTDIKHQKEWENKCYQCYANKHNIIV
jgi:hypothetical protein